MMIKSGRFHATTTQPRAAAASALRAAGWVQQIGRSGLRCCLATAIDDAVSRPDGMPRENWEAFMDVSNALGFVNQAALIMWNDRPGRTIEEVIARLEHPPADVPLYVVP